MAFMRGDPYIYTDGMTLHIHHNGQYVALPSELADDLAAMIWHRKPPAEQQQILQRVAENYQGNFGADGVLAALGQPTAVDMVRAAVEVMGDDEA